MRKLSLLSGLFLVVEISLAQGFHIINAVPDEGMVNVPLSTIISFTFNAPLDTTCHFGDEDGWISPISVLGPEPADSAEVIEWWVNPDLTTISIQVEHLAERDFFWLVVGAYSDEGVPLTEPCCLHYSTASTMGPWTVSGTIDAGELDPTHTLIGLDTVPLFSDEGDGSMTAGTFVPDNSGDYTIPYVSNGCWWPIAAYDLDGDGEIDPEAGDLLGFWDPNQDNLPDSIIVEDGNLTGIDITLLDFIFDEVTAQELLPEAWVLAEEWAADQELHMIGSGGEINLDGTAAAWGYLFWSPAGEFFTNIMLTTFFSQVDTTTDIGFPSDMIPLPVDFINSDEAMSIAGEQGGTQFEEEYMLEERWLHGGNFSWVYPESPDDIAWVAGYSGYDPDNGNEVELHIAMDIVTGEIIQIHWDDVREPLDEILPAHCELLTNYPNPFNPATTIPYQLNQAGFIRLQVFDMLGREVALLVNEWQSAGFHEVQFDLRTVDRELSSGIYLCRLQMGKQVTSRRITLVK